MGYISRRELILASVSTLLAGTPEVIETEDNQEGPYYKAGAPVRSNLIEKGMRGTPLLLTGRVLGLDGRPLSEAELDVWHANGDGEYDNQGYRLRGKLYTAHDGHYELHTIVPRFYQAGSAIRPAHIHLKVHKGEGPVLTTQLYFRGDPYNYADSSVRPSLLLDLDSAGDGRRAEFDFRIRTR